MPLSYRYSSLLNYHFQNRYPNCLNFRRQARRKVWALSLAFLLLLALLSALVSVWVWVSM